MYLTYCEYINMSFAECGQDREIAPDVNFTLYEK